MSRLDGLQWRSFQSRFQEIAEHFPSRVALADSHHELRYHQLKVMTDGLSLLIQRCGGAQNDLIVVFMPSSIEYVVACLSILKAGSAFLPIPIDLPPRQVGLILADAKPKVILTTPSSRELFEHITKEHEVTESVRLKLGERINLKIDQSELNCSVKITNPNPEERAVVEVDEESYAFATYTSGTTGKPKGVIQIQRALVESYDARHRFNPYGDEERVACNVFFMWEILRPLLVGGTTFVIPDELLAQPKQLVQLLLDHQVTEVLFTPSAFQRVIRSLSKEELKSSLRNLRTIWLNGEVVTSKLVKEALSALPLQVKLLNTYSICECHDVANSNLRALNLDLINDEHKGICPVGRPDIGVIVKLRSGEELLDEGEGELYIRGHGLGAGYLHLPELSAERFPSIAGDRYYATGDRATINQEGQITIHGRLGNMVKMRGYSVYLNAIEEALNQHPIIKDVRVFLRGDHLSQHLTAFVIGQQGALSDWINERTQSAPKLREWLKNHLPSYMIPSIYVSLEYFPVHPISGKLDQHALWDLERQEVLSLEELKQMPQETWAECIKLMTLLWARALELDAELIGPMSDFYDLGGHSLSMVDLVLSVEEVFDLKLDGDELYESPLFGDYLTRILKDRLNTLLPSEHILMPSQDSHGSQDQAFDLNHPTDRRLPFWEDSDLQLDLPLSSINQSGTHGTSERVTLEAAKQIFLTGATGYLGLALLDSLLAHAPQNSTITCLIRRSSDLPAKSGETRLAEKLSDAGFCELNPLLLSGRVRVVEGDITEHMFGLDEGHYQRLANEIDLIFHCAAFVNLRASYTQMKPSIVDGARALIRFAATEKLKTLHHISTNSVLSVKTDGSFPERPISLDDATLLKDGYSQAKWAAEYLMDKAKEFKIPITIYRPGNIGPHRYKKYVNPNDLSTMIWRSCSYDKSAPSNCGWRFELTPVDMIAEMITEISKLTFANEYYHLVHPFPIDGDSLFEILKSHGKIDQVSQSWQDWREELLHSSEPSNRILGGALPHFNELLVIDDRFSVQGVCKDIPHLGAYYSRSPELEVILEHFFK